MPRLLALLTALMLCLAATASAQFRDGVGGLPSAPEPAPNSAAAKAISEFQERAVISSQETMRTEDDVAYASGRTKVDYQQYSIEADRMVIDFVTEEIQAEGNVIFRGPTDFIRATSGRFNMGTKEGVAYGVNGQSEDFYFTVVQDEKAKGPGFRQVSEMQSIFRGTHFTTCDFPVPHYYVASREIIYDKGRRIYFKSAVVWVRGIPVFWFPVYSRGLRGSPWSIEVGYNSSLGAFMRVGYRYIHKVSTPGFEDPTKYTNRSHGQMDAHLDLMTSRGAGFGWQYRYQFDYKRHVGFMEVYGIRDSERDIAAEGGSKNDDDETPDALDDEDDDNGGGGSGERWVYRHKHNSMLRDDLIFQMDIDEASDPDVYEDILDYFAPDQSGIKRGRMIEQRMRGALTYLKPNYVVRGGLEQKERLTRNRYTDYADPFDDDLDYDPDPNFESESEGEKGIPSTKYGVVTQRGQLRTSTRLLNLGNSPLFYRFEANAFRALDAGFNERSQGDDSWITGTDAYGALTHRLRLSDRTTWTNTIGLGAAAQQRDEDRLISDDDFIKAHPTPTPNPDGTLPTPTPIPDEFAVDGVRYIEEDAGESIYISDSETKADIGKSAQAYAFGDYTSRLNHRFSQFLDGYLQYRIRETSTKDTLGEFYEKVGKTEAAGDIYDFPTREHLAEAGMNFYLRYPDIFATIQATQNLQSDYYPNERIRSVGFFTSYKNPRKEFQVDLGAGFETRQIRDRDDPNGFEQGGAGGNLKISYYPRHARYWAQLNVNGSMKLDDDPLDDQKSEVEKNKFDENESEINLSPVLGRRFGPKYRAQIGANYNTKENGLQSIGITILRDLHDAELGIFIGFKSNTFGDNRENDEEDIEDDENTADDLMPEIKATLKLKVAKDQPGLGQRSVTTLSDLRQEAQYVE